MSCILAGNRNPKISQTNNCVVRSHLFSIAELMLAASVWANPEMGKYIHTFNSTAVAQELSASFVNSLPLIFNHLAKMRRVRK